MKKWVILDKSKKRLPEDIIKILLKNRGIEGKREIDDFLNSSLDCLNIKNVGLKKRELDKAVSRIKKAIRKGESIVVYTDYDVDGVCGGAIVWETLYALGAKVMPYIPHRVKEGYGLSKTGIDFVKKEYNSTLIITVDHGVSGGQEIDYAKKLGIDTIVLDHHLLPKKTPLVQALIHTEKLAAGGIALLFADYLLSKLSTQKNDDSKISNLELATLATVADLVPLVGPNRIIVKYGLEYLNKTKRLGLEALIEDAGLKKGELDVYQISHIIAPRINASGRMSYALDALRLLCTRDRQRANDLAKYLGATNRERQVVTKELTILAQELVRHELTYTMDFECLGTRLLFISHKEFKEGIIGLVAGKLVEEFYRPAIVVAKGEEYSKASARSVSGFDIVKTIRQVSDLLKDVGGHPMAAGFTVATKNLNQVKKRLIEIANKELDREKLTKTLKVDLKISLNSITPELFKLIKQLSPFGVGNPEPAFVSRNIEVISALLVGKEKKHLKLLLRDNMLFNSTFSAIGFGMGGFYNELSRNRPIDIVYSIVEDKWNSNSALQLKLKDVNLSSKSKD